MTDQVVKTIESVTLSTTSKVIIAFAVGGAIGIFVGFAMRELLEEPAGDVRLVGTDAETLEAVLDDSLDADVFNDVDNEA